MSKLSSLVIVCLLVHVASAQPSPDEASAPVETVGAPIEEIDVEAASEEEAQDPDQPDAKEPAPPPCVPLDQPTAPKNTKAAKSKKATASLRFDLASVKNWPEFKVTHPVKTVAKIFGKKVKTKVPQSWRRSCKKKVYAEVSYPKALEDKGKTAIKSCSTKAVAAAAVVALEAGPAGALPTFTGALEACVKLESAKLANEIDASIDTEKNCSKWKKV